MFKLVACADANHVVATQKAALWGIDALSVPDLLGDPRVQIVLNLTTPQHHVDVGIMALAAGKHVYAEKPLGIALSDGLRLATAADAAGLRVGSAPDTFLGGSHQTARAALDLGVIGEVVAGTAHMMVPGHEIWHPNPDFYYQPGGGPMLDMGPYYLTCLINLLGPVQSVFGATQAAYKTRKIGSGPRKDQLVAVNIPTHWSAILTFVCGAQVTLTTSFDVWKHQHNHIELYGTKGSMIIPDPNQFQGEVLICEKDGDWRILPQAHGYGDGNYRSLGLADMAAAISAGRAHRASLPLALHVLEVMEAVGLSAKTGQRVDPAAQCTRPAAMCADNPFSS